MPRDGLNSNETVNHEREMTKFHHKKFQTMSKFRLMNKKVMTEFHHKKYETIREFSLKNQKGDENIPPQEIPDDEENASEKREQDT